MAEVKRGRGRPRKVSLTGEEEKRILTEGEKIMIEWVVMMDDGYNTREAWKRVYSAFKTSKGRKTTLLTVDTESSRFANIPAVKEYARQCREKLKLRNRKLRDDIEKEIFESDERIEKFILGREDRNALERMRRRSASDMGAIVDELNELAGQIEDPKDRAQILMKIADFRGMTRERADEGQKRQYYVPVSMDACAGCALYRLGREVLEQELANAGGAAGDGETEDGEE